MPINTRQYDIHRKRSNGWETLSLKNFFARYETTKRRREVISDPKVGYIFDKFYARKLSLEEGINLLYRKEYSLCQSYLDLEPFIQTYKNLEDKSLILEAIATLKEELLDADLLYILMDYQKNFPDGFFIIEAETKEVFLRNEIKQKNKPNGEVEVPEENSIKTSDRHKENYKTLEALLNQHNNLLERVKDKNDTNLDIIKILEKQRDKIASSDIAQLLKELLELIKSSSLSKDHYNNIISISADFRKYQFEEVQGYLPLEETRRRFNLIVNRLIKAINLLIAEFNP